MSQKCLSYVWMSQSHLLYVWMSKRCILYVMDALKTSFLYYGCLYVFCKLWMSLSLLYVMDVKKNVFCILWIFERHIFALWMSQRGLLYVINVSNTFFVFKRHLSLYYECLKEVFCILWMSQIRLLYVMIVSKTYVVCYGCLKDVFCMLWMSLRFL